MERYRESELEPGEDCSVQSEKHGRPSWLGRVEAQKRSYRRRRHKPQINRYYQEKLHEKASEPPRADKAENADDDEVKRDDIIQESGPQEDQDAGQDGDDGLQGDVIHEGDP
jgi:hypothetical protein